MQEETTVRGSKMAAEQAEVKLTKLELQLNDRTINPSNQLRTRRTKSSDKGFTEDASLGLLERAEVQKGLAPRPQAALRI